VVADGERVGILGQLRPELQEVYKFLEPVWVAEIELEPLYRRPLPQPKYQPLERFPSVQNDVSFLIDKRVEYTTMVSVVEELALPDLRGVQLIDLYQGPRLPEDKVSLTLRLTFANPEKTLTQEEVNGYTEKVFSVLLATFSAELRS